MNRRYIIRCVAVAALFIATANVPAQQTSVADSRPTAPNIRAEEVLTRPVTVRLDKVELKAALHAIGRSAGVRIQSAMDLIEMVKHPVTLNANNLPLGTVLARVLTGTPLRAVVLDWDVIEIGSARTTPSEAQGIIMGRITDAKSARPLRGAKINVDGVDRAETIDNGTYRVTVGPGTRTVVVKMLGYTKVTRTVTAQDNTVVTADMVLASSVMPLSQVIVTGTVIATERKAVPNAITVITARQIEERGITHIDQLFRGDVPGLFAQNSGSSNALDAVTMFSRGTTALPRGASTASNGTNPIKTYVDGVELADPQWLSQIDPRSVERIEILSGPQASTIYGSNAINGVMQIFTKRGTASTPQLTLNLLSGVVQNDFSRALTPQHDYSAQLNGVESYLSYNGGGSWGYIGPWTPAKQTTRMSGFGGTRLALPTAAGQVSVDVTLLRTNAQNRDRGSSTQGTTSYQKTGWYQQVGNFGLDDPTDNVFGEQTLGLTLGYAPTNWWSHELGVGQDVSEQDVYRKLAGYLTSSDSALNLSQRRVDKRSLRYTTTMRVPLVSLAEGTITVGADAWQRLLTSVSGTTQSLTGTLTGIPSVERRPGHNTGGFLQAQLGILDKLFLTYGLRGEWNPAFGEEAQPNYCAALWSGIFTGCRDSSGSAHRQATSELRAFNQTSRSKSEEFADGCQCWVRRGRSAGLRELCFYVCKS